VVIPRFLRAPDLILQCCDHDFRTGHRELSHTFKGA
jgi:hypothetical protein